MSSVTLATTPPLSPTGGRTHITFIGGGTMACAILDGLTDYASTASKSGQKSEYSFTITHRRQEKVAELQKRYPGSYVTDNNDDTKLWSIPYENGPVAHIIMICTKPQQTLEVCDSIRRAYETAPAQCTLPTVVTMCPGIMLSQLESWLTLEGHPRPFPVVRTMPNTPVSARQGATALIASQHATIAEVERVTAFYRVFSPCVEALQDESLLDVVAAVSGSGPAYIFQFYKTLVAAGVQWGLPESLARALVMQTAVGASMLANNQPEISLGSMIGNVCVPGGSTEKGIKRLVDFGLQQAVTNAVSTSLEANHGMKGHK